MTTKKRAKPKKEDATIYFKPEINNSSRAQGGSTEIINDSYNRGIEGGYRIAAVSDPIYIILPKNESKKKNVHF